MSQRLRGAWMTTALASALLVVSASPATASCAEPVPLDQALEGAQTVFVGTVTHLQYNGLVATFQVDDVWKGGVGVVAVVNGGLPLSELEAARAQGQEVLTSVDRTYESGRKYLVVSFGRDGALYTDNICSATRLFTGDLEQLRPASAYTPVAPDYPDSGTEEPVPWVAIGLAAMVVGGTAGTVVRHRRVRLDHAATIRRSSA